MAAVELLSAMGSAASLIQLADQVGSSTGPERRMIGNSKAPPIGLGISNIRNLISGVRRKASQNVSDDEVETVEALPDSAVQKLREKAVEAEAIAANKLASMDGVDRVAIMMITDQLRADMCTILHAISDLSGGDLPDALQPKWKQFKCA